MEDLLQDLLSEVKTLGLNDDYIEICQEYLDCSEYGICFDTLANYLHDNEISINESTYESMLFIVVKMKLSPKDYHYLYELVIKQNRLWKT